MRTLPLTAASSAVSTRAAALLRRAPTSLRASWGTATRPTHSQNTGLITSRSIRTRGRRRRRSQKAAACCRPARPRTHDGQLVDASTCLKSSERRIRDLDMAREMMTFTRLNILSQSGTSMRTPSASLSIFENGQVPKNYPKTIPSFAKGQYLFITSQCKMSA